MPSSAGRSVLSQQWRARAESRPLQPSRAQPGWGRLLGVQVVVGSSSLFPCIIPAE